MYPIQTIYAVARLIYYKAKKVYCSSQMQFEHTFDFNQESTPPKPGKEIEIIQYIENQYGTARHSYALQTKKSL